MPIGWAMRTRFWFTLVWRHFNCSLQGDATPAPLRPSGHDPNGPAPLASGRRPQNPDTYLKAHGRTLFAQCSCDKFSGYVTVSERDRENRKMLCCHFCKSEETLDHIAMGRYDSNGPFKRDETAVQMDSILGKRKAPDSSEILLEVDLHKDILTFRTFHATMNKRIKIDGC